MAIIEENNVVLSKALSCGKIHPACLNNARLYRLPLTHNIFIKVTSGQKAQKIINKKSLNCFNRLPESFVLYWNLGHVCMDSSIGSQDYLSDVWSVIYSPVLIRSKCNARGKDFWKLCVYKFQSTVEMAWDCYYSSEGLIHTVHWIAL